MTLQNVHFIWNEPQVVRRFESAVSLHSHTDRSREGLGGALPSLTPAAAYRVEAGQIEALGLDSMVSITDHNTIDGPNQLRCFLPAGKVPLSLEWTVPFERGYFHVGVHNLPADIANEIVYNLLEVPCSQCQASGIICNGTHDARCMLHVSDWMQRLASIPDTLLVLNHPLWDTWGSGQSSHQELLKSFLSTYKGCLHALELNGLRTWQENMEVMALAREWNLPVISGGDRHGREPNAVVNLTATTDFSSFTQEIRAGGPSVILFLAQYQQPLTFRKLRAAWDVLKKTSVDGGERPRWKDRIRVPSAAFANKPVVRPQTA